VLQTVETLLSFLLVLGVLIFVHELGHFLVARWYGVRVLTFSLGFGPKILKVTRGGTEYCISAVPLGGYVKMAGENAQDERQGLPDEFLSKSKWVRFQVYLAGPVMNILLAVVVLTVVLSGGADVPKYNSAPPVIGSVSADSAAAKAGLQPGDLVVSIDGKTLSTWDEFQMAILPKANRPLALVIDRAGARQTITVTPTAETKYEFGTLGVGPVLHPQIINVRPGMPGERAGFKRGDVLLSVGGQSNLTREQTVAVIKKNGPTPITFHVERDGQPMDITVTPDGPVGSAVVGFDISTGEYKRVNLSVPQAFRMSLTQNWENSQAISRGLKDLITRETPVKQLMGPIAIADLSGAAAKLGWRSLLDLMAMISLNLALLNLMPVPVLDGGQIAILILEGVARRDMSSRAKERIAMVGAALILALMVTVIYNDIARMIR
jgi:regulator of sigma E protease